MRILFFVILISVAFEVSNSAECHGKPDPNAQPNLNPIAQPKLNLVGTVPNGKLYTVGDANSALKILHLWGTPYDMGIAHGTLLKKEAASFMNSVWAYLEDQVIQAINGTDTKVKFQEWFLRDVSNLGLEAACDLEIFATSKFSGDYFLQEIQGLAKASGVDYKKIQRIHMLGELTKGSCSMFGAWGSALPTSDSVLQLRALDWNMDGPFHNFPQLTVYHTTSNNTGPNGMKANSFVNVGWTGWIGSITGMSSASMAISEIGASYPDDTFGNESRFGVPFTYILRDILQFDYTLDDAINRIANADRTCHLMMGVGDGKEARGFRGVQYSATIARFYDDQNLKPDATWHPKIKDVVYYGMDWMCPSYNELLAKQINKYYGSITPAITVSNIVPIVQTGSTHIAIYDLTNDMMFVSFAKADIQTGPPDAYDRQFMEFNMKQLFTEQMPK